MKTEAKKPLSPFAMVTLIAGVIAISLIVWRISKAWRIEYGGAPREAPGIPTGGSFGPPGGAAAPTTGALAAPTSMTAASATTTSAPAASTTAP